VTRRRLHFVIALLLPLMALRALLPAGYMLDSGHGALRVVMCSEGLHSAPVGENSDPSNGNGHGQRDSGSCPFAQATMNAPPPSASPSIVMVRFEAGAVPAFAAPIRSTSLVRVQSARGPPSLSL
jgi:hypothetical protein